MRKTSAAGGLIVLLGLATVALYWPVGRYPFIDLDDPLYVTGNAWVSRGLSWDGVRWAGTALTAANWHPLTWMSHMADVSLFGMKAGYHHLVGVLIHGCNAILLFLLFRQLTGALWRSALVAALFAFHPLHVESVAWVAERKDVLSTLFGLLAISRYVAYRRRPSAGRYLGVAALFAASLMAKPMLVTLPFILLLLDFWPLGHLTLPGGPASSRRISPSGIRSRFPAGIVFPLIEKVPLLLLSLASSLVTYHAQQTGGAVRSAEYLPFPARIANAVVSYAVYLRKTFWPADLAIFYPHPQQVPSWWLLGGSFVLLAALTGIAVHSRHRRPHWAAGWFWYVGTLVPVIGLVQVGAQAMADRYTYVPLVGIFLALAWSLPRAAPRLPVAAGAALVLGALGLIAREQVTHWRDVPSLHRQALRVTEGNWFAHNNLGVALDNQGLLAEAFEHYSAAVALNPGYKQARYNLGRLLDRTGRAEEAMREYRVALRIDPNYVKAHYNLGILLTRAGRKEEAAESYRRAIEIDPSHSKSHANLGLLLWERGLVQEAHDSLARAVRSDAEDAVAHVNLGLILSEMGRTGEARREFQESLRLDPSLEAARMALERLPR